MDGGAVVEVEPRVSKIHVPSSGGQGVHPMHVGRGGGDIVHIYILHLRAVGDELEAHLIEIEVAVGCGIAVKE